MRSPFTHNFRLWSVTIDWEFSSISLFGKKISQYYLNKNDYKILTMPEDSLKFTLFCKSAYVKETRINGGGYLWGAYNRNTVKPVLSGLHIKWTPFIKRTPQFPSHVHFKTNPYAADTSIKRTPKSTEPFRYEKPALSGHFKCIKCLFLWHGQLRKVCDKASCEVCG